MSAVNKYEIYCTTEDTYVIGWGETPPTKCYNNALHDVNPNSVQLLDTIASNVVTIKEDQVTVTGNKWIQSINITGVAPQETKSTVYTFPITMSLYSFMFVADSANDGDYISIIGNENTNVGLITGDLSTGATTIGLSALAISKIVPGFYISLTNGVNTDDLGLVLSIDKVNNTVTVQTAATHSFTASNTYAIISVKVLNNLLINGAGFYRFFDDVIGGTAVQAGGKVTIKYTNNDPLIGGTTKKIAVYLTCVY